MSSHQPSISVNPLFEGYDDNPIKQASDSKKDKTKSSYSFGIGGNIKKEKEKTKANEITDQQTIDFFARPLKNFIKFDAFDLREMVCKHLIPRTALTFEMEQEVRNLEELQERKALQL